MGKNLLFVIVFGLVVNSRMSCRSDVYVQYLHLAFLQFESIDSEGWSIINKGRVDYDDFYRIDIEAFKNRNDTACQLGLAVTFTSDTSVISLLKYTEEYMEEDTCYHVSFGYDSILVPKYKYKFSIDNPKDLIFEFGKENVFGAAPTANNKKLFVLLSPP